ncbi:MAG: 23S rRNA (adenine(2503)-C(2))-methyltransferase RlmN, partial [Alphaproteobacteria bacterium]
MNELSASPPDTLTSLIGMDRAELARAVEAIGEPEKSAILRAKQLWHWIYHHGVDDFSHMTSLNGALRDALAASYTLERPKITREQKSQDGTRKWLLRFADGQEAESVFIPEEDRGALCMSSQVGCTLTCRFCHTGTQRLVRNLDAREIISQFMVARDAYGEWPSPRDGRMISNIVMMGMGEPLFNYDNVAKAMHIAMDPEGLSISRRRITLSTAGVAPLIERCGAELGVGLAISLHAVTDNLRDELMPINRKYPLAQLLDACRRYPSASNARRITFEYVMLKWINDSRADAKALVRLIAGIPAKINLIPFNAWPGAPYECSEPDVIAEFARIVNKA